MAYDIRSPLSNKSYGEASLVIIGSGISGICLAIDLIRHHGYRNFVILEKSTGIGGTWRDNRYPGCCCDVWSHLYSYSFEQNPDWTADYASQEEILTYLEGIARKYDLYRHIRFGTSVDRAEWDETENAWKVSVTVSEGKEAEFSPKYSIKTPFLVSAVGQLNIPKLPDIPGLSEYKGKVMHSARWDWSYDISHRRVAVIGVGSTAAQIVPEVAKVAESLTVHQRAPNWIVPRFNMPIPPWRRALYRYLPIARWLKRSSMMDFREDSYATIVTPTPEREAWFQDVSTEHMKAQLLDRPELWQALLPKYRIGCKRVVVSDDYYPTFLRPNVRLETGRIDRMSEKGIVVDGKEFEYDLVIMATGFRSVDFMYPIDIIGRNGTKLSDVWSHGPEALYGVCVEKLPNFAMLYGPNTNLSHNSIILMIEAQSRYICALVNKVLGTRASGVPLVLQPKASRIAQYNNRLQSELNDTNYADPGCNSWYKLGPNGKITNNWSRTAVAYQKLLSSVAWSDFDISGLATAKDTNQVTVIGRITEESTGRSKAYGIFGLAVAASTCYLLYWRLL